MLNHADALYLDELRSVTMAHMREVIGPDAQEIIMLDTPRHRNLGDSIIWEGTFQYLQKLGHRIIHQSDLGRHRDSDLNRFSPSAVIVMQGGGNMGDLYPEHDLFRQHIVTNYPKRKIVIMPQSVHYQDANVMNRAMTNYSKGSNVTLFLREHRSLDAVDKWASMMDVRFCYDAALGATIENPFKEPSKGPLILARNDEERLDSAADLPPLSTDWSYGLLNRFRWHTNILAGAAYKRAPSRVQNATYSLSQKVNAHLLHLNVRAAIAQFAGHNAVATDRLHAHVLAVLLGIPHAVTDNSYGKISSIYDEYTGRFSTAHWATNLKEAMIFARNSHENRESKANRS